MNIPNFIDLPIANKDGTLTEEWKHVFSQLFYELQKKASEEGLQAPSQNTLDIDRIVAGAGTKKNGTFLYDEDLHKQYVVINGVKKEISTV